MEFLYCIAFAMNNKDLKHMKCPLVTVLKQLKYYVFI